MKINLYLFLALSIVSQTIVAQSDDVVPNKPIKFDLNEDGSNYIRATGLAQVWLRRTDMNPETRIGNTDMDSYNDISIRRLRFQIYGQITDRVFFYTQFGQNNFNFHSEKYQGAFFHDALVEYGAIKKKLTLGTGLASWSGQLRYATPSAGAILGLDLPIYQQVTNGVNDQFVRKLSLYAKGQLGKLDYRISVVSPMTLNQPDVLPTSKNYSFSSLPAKAQLHSYLKWMFMDAESNLAPFHAGTYLGKKSILNIGAGFIYQPDAMWAIGDLGQTKTHEMLLLGVDIFYDKPLSENTALTVYTAYSHYDLGSNYIRNVGVNNPGTSASTGSTHLGYGNSFPMVGNGDTVYGQAAFLFGENIMTENGKLQPFASLQISDYDFSDDLVRMYEFGANYFINGTQNSRVSFMYQNRPVFKSSASESISDGYAGMYVIQYQVSF